MFSIYVIHFGSFHRSLISFSNHENNEMCDIISKLNYLIKIAYKF